MLTEKEYMLILDFDWTGVNVREMILRIKAMNPVAEAISSLRESPKEWMLTQIFKKMANEDIDILEKKLYGTGAQSPINDVFIIHSDSDREISVALENELKSVFGEKLRVFNASNPDGIKGGEDWFNHIARQHRNSKLGLVLITENALSNFWINFEAGGFFLRKNNAIIPILFDASVLEKLTFPLKGIQGKKLWEDGFRKSLIAEIADQIGIASYDYNDERFCKNVLEIYSQEKVKNGIIKSDFNDSSIKKTLIQIVRENMSPMISTKEIHDKLKLEYHSDQNEIGLQDTFDYLEKISSEGKIRKVPIDGATMESTIWRILK